MSGFGNDFGNDFGVAFGYSSGGMWTLETATWTINIGYLETPLPARTLGDEFTITVRVDEPQYLTLREYQRWAGRVTTGESQSGVWFEERVPATASINSLVVGLSPDNLGAVFEGFWGVLTDVSEENPLPSNLTMELSFVYLGEYDEYVDADAVTANLAVSPF